MIRSKFPVVPLEELAAKEKAAIKIGPFGSQLKKSELASSGIHVLGIENVLHNRFDGLGERYISEEKFMALRSVEVKPGDILITMMGTVGKLAVIPEGTGTSIMDSHLIRFRPNTDLCDIGYIAWAIKCSSVVKQSLDRNARGAIMQGLNSGIIRRLPIPLPPFAEQKRIAAILKKADSIRRKRQTSIGLADDLLRATFLDMFGDAVTNPKGWEIVECGSICERITVGIVVRPASYYQASGIPALRSLNIRPNQITTDNLVYFSSEDNSTRLAKTRVWKDDLLLVRSGQPGTAAVVPSDLDGVNAIDIIIATPDKSKADPVYLCFYFNSEGGNRLVLGEQRGQIQKHLNVGSLKVAPIPLPPISLQREFAVRVQKIRDTKERLMVGSQGFTELFNSLTQRAFRGEL